MLYNNFIYHVSHWYGTPWLTELDPAPKSKTFLCAALACSDLRAVFRAVLLAEGPPALSAAAATAARRRGRAGSWTSLLPASSGGGDSASARPTTPRYVEEPLRKQDRR